MKIAYLLDSTVVLHESLINHPHIHKIPITILINDKEYLDGIDITNEQLFELMKDSNNKITTSLPSVGKFVEVYEELLRSYDYIISLMISEHLSGTYNTACIAAQMVGENIKVVNTNLISYPISYLILKGINKLNVETMDKWVAKVESMYEKNETYVIVDNLERLHKSGRLSDLTFFIGSLLNISPLIMLQDGKLKVKEKVRTSKKAKEKLLNYLKQAQESSTIKEVAVLYTANIEEAKKYVASLREKFHDIEFTIYPLGTALAVHAGESAIGISWFKE